ncbi:MAG: response regulator [Paludibacteraceae bacterium]|nr:response regulator [Paludibacteraceae bacterium]
MTLKKLFSIIVFCLATSILAAQKQFYFDHYSTKDGLSCDLVYAITQDANGFIWAATEYGLNRLDGTQIKVYTNDSHPSIYRNDIRCLNVLSDGTMIMGGTPGLALSYDAKADTFRQIQFDELQHPDSKTIINLERLSDGRDYALTSNGLYRFDENELSASGFSLTNYTVDRMILSAYIDKASRYWLGSFDGIKIYSSGGKILETYALDGKDVASSIIEVDKSHILVGSNIGNLWFFTLDKNNKIVETKIIKTDFRNISSMIKDKDGMIWIGTWGHGLWCMDKHFRLEEIINQEDKNAFHKVQSLYEDRDGNIWIGSQENGLWCCRKNFANRALHSSKFGFPNAIVSCFYEASDGSFYVGSDGYGMYQRNSGNNTWRHWEVGNGLKCNNVLAFEETADRGMLIATWSGGVSSLQKNAFSSVFFNGINNPITSTKHVKKTKNGETWVLTQGDGVYVETAPDKWKKLVFKCDRGEDNWTDYFVEDGDVKWLITSFGIWRCDAKDTVSYPLKKNSIDYFTFYHGTCDKDGNFYATSNHGIVRFSADGKEYKLLEYLPKGNYVSICIDKNNTIWCAGSPGIIQVDPIQETYHTLPFNSLNHNATYFSQRAVYIGKDGNIYWGCSDGFLYFNPDSINQISNIDYLAWGDLHTDNHTQRINGEDITIDQGTNQVSITFDLLNLSGINDIQCHYRINSLGNGWQPLGSSREIKLNYIPAGDYILEVEAYRNNSADKASTISIKLHVLPPWWQTTWFKIIISCLISSAIAMLIYARMRSMKQREEELERLVDNRTSDLMNTMKEKDRLVSIIAHDLKNPMFSIVRGLEILSDKTEGKIPEKEHMMLNTIQSSATNLQKELLQLLEWSASHQSTVQYSPKDVNLRLLLDDVIALLKGPIEDKLISIQINDEMNKCANVDERLIATVMRNLIDNAIKFTPKRGFIKLSLYEDNNQAIFTVQDSGVGMDKETLDKLRSGAATSTRGTDNEIGTGLGFRMCSEFVAKNNGTIHIDSEKDKGTSITICLPMSDKIAEKEQAKTEYSNSATTSTERSLMEGNTVLIVDDEPMIRLAIRNALEPYMNVLEAGNGKDGFDIATKEIPDFIVADVEMPQMNGFEMYQNLKEQKSTAHIPLLFLSALSDENIRMEGLTQGAIDYMTKPFKDEELSTKVINILKLRRTQQQQILMENYTEEPVSTEINPFLKSVLDAIEENYQNSEFTIEDLAKLLSTSKSTLQRRIKSITDQTPIELLNEYRVKKADSLLRNQDLPIKEVAYMTGFSDQFYFSRKYKEYFGYAPSKR